MDPFEAFTHWRDHWSDIQAHLLRLYTATRRGEGIVLELGTRGGVSTSAFLTGIEIERQSHGHLWSVDRDNCADLFAECDAWTFVQADSCDVQALEAAGLPDNIDVLFIDTEHTEEQTFRELTTWGPRVRPGGVILLHDAYDGSTFPGVIAACMHYCDPRGLDLRIKPGSYGLAVIGVPA